MKYAEVYIKDDRGVQKAVTSLRSYFRFYNYINHWIIRHRQRFISGKKGRRVIQVFIRRPSEDREARGGMAGKLRSATPHFVSLPFDLISFE